MFNCDVPQVCVELIFKSAYMVHSEYYMGSHFGLFGQLNHCSVDCMLLGDNLSLLHCSCITGPFMLQM